MGQYTLLALARNVRWVQGFSHTIWTEFVKLLLTFLSLKNCAACIGGFFYHGQLERGQVVQNSADNAHCSLALRNFCVSSSSCSCSSSCSRENLKTVVHRLQPRNYLDKN